MLSMTDILPEDLQMPISITEAKRQEIWPVIPEAGDVAPRATMAKAWLLILRLS